MNANFHIQGLDRKIYSTVLLFSNIYKDEQWNMLANTNERIQRT